MYVTLEQLSEIPGALELAQVASDAHGALVDAELLELSLLGADRSFYDPEDVAAADRAVERIEEAVREADGLIDGYLGARYTLPLANPPGMLSIWSRAIARYKLHGDRISGEGTDPIVRDYKDAIRFLEQVAAGKFSLGAEDPSGAGVGSVCMVPGRRDWGRR